VGDRITIVAEQEVLADETAHGQAYIVHGRGECLDNETIAKVHDTGFARASAL
jgi:hypothetical protein